MSKDFLKENSRTNSVSKMDKLMKTIVSSKQRESTDNRRNSITHMPKTSR